MEQSQLHEELNFTTNYASGTIHRMKRKSKKTPSDMEVEDVDLDKIVVASGENSFLPDDIVEVNELNFKIS